MLEQDIKRLEEIAKALEEGTNLDEGLKLYEEGCKLAKKCLEQLEKAKLKVTMIKKEYEDKENDEKSE
ncbi:MAG: exodeoxyribonuclease VII small subunit [Clostridiales bacterium]|nr:exodeoxyribonuclease VII small subunit [Clostridiales bacterium]